MIYQCLHFSVAISSNCCANQCSVSRAPRRGFVLDSSCRASLSALLAVLAMMIHAMKTNLVNDSLTRCTELISANQPTQSRALVGPHFAQYFSAEWMQPKLPVHAHMSLPLGPMLGFRLNRDASGCPPPQAASCRRRHGPRSCAQRVQTFRIDDQHEDPCWQNELFPVQRPVYQGSSLFLPVFQSPCPPAYRAHCPENNPKQKQLRQEAFKD